MSAERIDTHRNQLIKSQQDNPERGDYMANRGGVIGAKRRWLNRRTREALTANPPRGTKIERGMDENTDLHLVGNNARSGNPKERLQRVLADLPEDVQQEARRLTVQPDAAIKTFTNALKRVAGAKKARAHLWEDGYNPTGSSLFGIFGGDAAMLTHDGLAVFQKFGPAGLGDSDKNTADGKVAPDDLLSFEDIARGNVDFTVGERESRGNGLALAKLFLGKGIDRGSVVVTNRITGRKYTLMDVREPETFCRNVRNTAQAIHEEGEAYKTIAELQATHPELFTNSE